MSCPNCATLRGELHKLRVDSGATVDPLLAQAISRSVAGLPPAASRILAALYASQGRVMSPTQLSELGGIALTSLKVHIQRIRAALGADAVYTLQRCGYQMTAVGRRNLKELLGGGIPVDALNDDAETPLPLAIAMLIGRHAHSEGPAATYTILDNIRSALEKQYGRSRG